MARGKVLFPRENVMTTLNPDLSIYLSMPLTYIHAISRAAPIVMQCCYATLHLYLRNVVQVILCDFKSNSESLKKTKTNRKKTV